MHLTHNQHKNYYQTVTECIADETHGYGADCWISEEQKQKAIATNDCWHIQWYPHTPVSFYEATAADLDALLAYAEKG